MGRGEEGVTCASGKASTIITVRSAVDTCFSSGVLVECNAVPASGRANESQCIERGR